MFRWYTNEFKYNLRDKRYQWNHRYLHMWGYDIFTREDIVSFLSICYHSVYHWLLFNKNSSLTRRRPRRCRRRCSSSLLIRLELMRSGSNDNSWQPSVTREFSNRSQLVSVSESLMVFQMFFPSASVVWHFLTEGLANGALGTVQNFSSYRCCKNRSKERDSGSRETTKVAKIISKTMPRETNKKPEGQTVKDQTKSKQEKTFWTQH